MGKSNIQSLILGGMGTNCYILSNNETREALVIDPEGRPERIKQYLDKNELHAVAILLTHGHFDHIGGAEGLKKLLSIPIYAGMKEEETLLSEDINLSTFFGAPMRVEADVLLRDKQILTLAGFSIEVIFTPGHTAGGVCYYIPEEKILLSGDTLFYCSVGRTDFPGGSSSTLVHSLRTRLFVLPEDTKVYPGHERSTSIGFEKKFNPYA